MSNSEIRTTLLHLRDSDDHDDQKLMKYADFRIYYRNLADATGSVRISQIDMKMWWIIFYSAVYKCQAVNGLENTVTQTLYRGQLS